MPRCLTLLAFITATVAFSTPSARAVIGVSWTGGINNATDVDGAQYDASDYSQYSIGWNFTVGANAINVSHLGMWDLDGDGVTGDQRVGIFNSGGTLISPVVTITNADPLDATTHFRWEAIPPVTLLAGQSYYLSSKAPQGGAAGGAGGFVGLTFGDGITFNTANYMFTGDSTLVAPTNVSGNPFGWFGPNMQFPEPASIVLVAAGAVMTMARRRRRA